MTILNQLFGVEDTSILVRKNFIIQAYSKFIKDKDKLFVMDKEDEDLKLPSKQQITFALSKTGVINKWYHKVNFNCRRFEGVLKGRLMELEETEQWCLGFTLIPYSSDSSTITSHQVVTILDNEGDVHIIDGQSGIDRILKEGEELTFVYI